MLTFLPLKRFRTLPLFMWFSLKVQRQLSRSKGPIGYSMDSDIRRLHFWTLSVWEDRDSLSEFIRALPHGDVMDKMTPLMGETKFIYWNVDASEIPLRWDAAKARMASAK